MVNIAEYKKKKIEEFVNLIKEYPIIAAVDMENLPTPQLQNMRAQLRKKVVLKMTKRRFMKIAFEQAKEFKPGIEKLSKYLSGMPALLFTKDNPFTLYKILQKNKSPAPAKAGQIAPRDIIIPAGPTSFAPGPLIGELGMLGLKTGVENGKIAIKENKVVVREGEEIKANVIGILTRFDIKPMEIGLGLTAAYENGTIFTSKILHIDETEYKQKFVDASGWAFNLAMDVGYPTKDNIELMLNNAHTVSTSLALSENILTNETIESVLAKAEIQMLSLKKTANIPDTIQENRFEENIKKPVKESIGNSNIKVEQAEEIITVTKHAADKDIKKAEKLIEQIRKGSIDADAQEKVPKGPSAEELVNELIANDKQEKKRQEAMKVPTAHELLQKKLKKEKEFGKSN